MVSPSNFERIGEKRDQQIGPLNLGSEIVLQHPSGKKLSGGPYVPAPGYWFKDSKGKKRKCENMWVFTWTSKMSCPSFSLPAGPVIYGGSCPAATTDDPNRPSDQTRICSACYAGKNLYLMGTAVIALSLARYAWVKREMQKGPGVFADQMIRAIRYLLSAGPIASRRGSLVGQPIEQIMAQALVSNRFFRIHDAGDMFSPDYYREWIRIAAGVPEVRFWAPIRVWARPHYEVDKILEPLVAAGVLDQPEIPENLLVRPSSLYTSGMPPEIPGLPAGSTSFIGKQIKQKVEGFRKKRVIRVDYPTGMSPAEHGIWDCPAFLGDDEHSCMAAGCRKCWVAPETPVSYLLH